MSDRSLDGLCAQLGLSSTDLTALAVQYRAIEKTKPDGRKRRILDPAPKLKEVQRSILDHVLSEYRSHETVYSYEEGRSIREFALAHARPACLVTLDIQDFFPSTTADRVASFFRTCGWGDDAVDQLVRLTTVRRAIPAAMPRVPVGAPTSPRLSNLINFEMDERLCGLATHFGVRFGRFADDMAFSGEIDNVGGLIASVARICAAFRYRLNRKKVTIARRGFRQTLTGINVDKERLSAPREKRRFYRSVAHRLQHGIEATRTDGQLEGWRSFERMIAAATREH